MVYSYISFRAFWLGIDLNARRRMSREKTESVLKIIVKHFFIEKEVTSTLVMDSLHSGLKALQGPSKKAKDKYLVDEEQPVPIVRIEKDTFVLVDDVLLLLERAAMEPLPPNNEKGPQNRTKDGSLGDDFSKDSIERDERRLTELGRRTIDIFVLAHIFSKIEVAYQEAVALIRQEELIREEEAAWLAESEQKMRRGVADKDKKSKKKQAKQKRNNRKVKDKGRYEKPDIAVEDDPERRSNDFLAQEAEPVGETHPLEDVSDVSDSTDCPPKPLQADSEERDSSMVNWDTDTSELHLTAEANGSGICGISFIQNGERKSPSVIDDSSSTCSTDSLPSVIANGPCKVTSLLKQNSLKSPSRGKYQRVKAIEEVTGCAVDTNIQPSNVSSDAGHVIYKSGKGKVVKTEKAISNSLQHRMKLTEQVAKKEGVASLQRKPTVTEEVNVEKPINVKTTGIQSSSRSPAKNLSSAVKPKLQSKIAAAIDTVLARKSSSLSAEDTDRLTISENLAETIVAKTAMPRLTQKPVSQLVPDSSEKSNIMQMSATTEKPVSQQVLVKIEKPTTVHPGISRPLSAPVISGPEICAPVVPMVQTAQSLSRSVSAAGRLGPDPSPATTSHVPQSYRNAMMGNHATTSSAGYTLTQSPNSAVNSSHSQPSSVMSTPMYLPQSSERLYTKSIRSNLSFGMLSHDVLQNGPPWMDSRSNCNSPIQNGPRWMENHRRDNSRSMNGDLSLRSDIQNFDMDNSLQSRSQGQSPIGFRVGMSGRQNPGVLADDFPHLDIINDLLDDEIIMATSSSGFRTFSNGPHHQSQQFTFPGDIGLSGDLGPSTSSHMFERTQNYHDDEYHHNYSSISGQFDSNIFHQANLQPYPDGRTEGFIPNQWQMDNSDLSYLSMRSSENDGFSYHIPEYSNLVSGVNGYTAFRPS